MSQQFIQPPTFRASPASEPVFWTASRLQEALTQGQFTSVDIVKAARAHIVKHNPYLHAVIDIAPEESLLSIAAKLDLERAEGKVRGPLHGIPFIVKDNVATLLSHGMRSTGGSFAMVDLDPYEDAECVQKLVAAGGILIAKANLSELAYSKGSALPCGWSAVGGQGQSPYVKGGWDPAERFGGHSGPGGSSSGSAVAVAAGLSPIALGTETWGSLIMPASRAGVFTLKPSYGLVSTKGILPVTDYLDVVGPLAKSATDIATVMDVLMGSSGSRGYPDGGYSKSLTGDFHNLTLGAVDTSQWKIDPALAEPDADWQRQQEDDFSAVFEILRQNGVLIQDTVTMKVELSAVSDIMGQILTHTFVPSVDGFLRNVKTSKVKNVIDLVAFNKENAELELPKEAPNQDFLESVLKVEAWTAEKSGQIRSQGVDLAGVQGIDATLKEYNIDIILGPADSWLTNYASLSGYPSATLPVSHWKKNGRPFCLLALASIHREDQLIQLQSAWENLLPWTPPPFQFPSL